MKMGRIVTNAAFFGGVFLVWIGDCHYDGGGHATIIAGGLLVIAGAARWLFEKGD
jgi:hypothetical protein